MLQTKPLTITNRTSILELFKLLQKRNLEQPLLPILAIIGPEGSGKQTLLNYLCFTQCCQPDGHPAQPYAFLDFAQPGTRSSLLSILVALRNQLQWNSEGKLTFPRFDLGALIASAASVNTLDDPNKIDIDAKIDSALPLLDNVSTALGVLIPPMASIMAMLKLGMQIPKVHNFLERLGRKEAFAWYRGNSDDRIIENSDEIDVLLRLQALSMLDNPQRTMVVEDLLPRAFMADLCEYMQNSDVNAVVFLDSFEVLQNNAESGSRLLKMLTMRPRNCQLDHLLIVLGSQRPLPGVTPDIPEGGKKPQDVARERLDYWFHQLPEDKSVLELDQRCLLLELPSFKLEDTHHYLAQRKPGLDTNEKLLAAIQKITNGNPRYVALVADALLQAQAKGETITADRLRALKSGGKLIQEAMLDLFLRQLSEKERNEIIFWAVPRAVDVETLRVVLELSTDAAAQSRWDYYHDSFTFVHPTTDQQHLVLPSEIRALLLQRLTDRDYDRAHQALRDHFHDRAIQDEQAQIEEAYHSLALGDPAPVIEYAIAAQHHNLAIWKPLLEAISQAPTRHLSEAIKQRASSAHMLAKQQKDLQNSITAIVLYIWMLDSTKRNKYEMAHLQHYLGDAYSVLPGGDKQSNLQKAREYYEACLSVFTLDFPDEWSETQNDLGTIYSELQIGDQQKNLEKAIEYYEKALLVRKCTTFPYGWAETRNDLGAAYRALPGGSRQENLERARECFQDVLDFCTPDIFGAQWAMAKRRLGNVYMDLPTATQRQENVQQAIQCYNDASFVHKKGNFSLEWAGDQNNLANAYSDLHYPNRRDNLKRAITGYMAALSVYQRETNPEKWAFVHSNLGYLYSDSSLPEEDQEPNVNQAIAHCNESLQIFTRERYPNYWANVQVNLGIANWALPTGDRKAHVQQAIACYQDALTIYVPGFSPDHRAEALHNLGNAYRDLPDEKRQENIQKALQCYEEALQLYSDSPYQFAWTKADQGIAYGALSGEDRQARLEQAIQCYKEALTTCRPQQYSEKWAMIQHHLGNAYRDRPEGERQVNIWKAIKCYEAALEVRKRETLPLDWAETQNELGSAYRYRQEGGLLLNFQEAIDRYEAALGMYLSYNVDYKVQEVHTNLDSVQREREVLLTQNV